MKRDRAVRLGSGLGGARSTSEKSRPLAAHTNIAAALPPPRARPTLTARRSRSVIERVIAHFKTWRIMHTDYRRPLNTFATTISAVVGLYFYLLA